MAFDRTLIAYLPPFMQEYTQMQGIFAAEQTEIETLWADCEDVFDDQFVNDATVNGVQRWEKILGINPKGSDTLDERKFRILVKLNEQLPYTFTTLNEQLTSLCGADGYNLTLNANAYILTVKVNLSNKNNFADVQELLERVVPANIVMTLELIYNTHLVLSEFTHGHLGTYTHSELRNEVLS